MTEKARDHLRCAAGPKTARRKRKPVMQLPYSLHFRCTNNGNCESFRGWTLMPGLPISCWTGTIRLFYFWWGFFWRVHLRHSQHKGVRFRVSKSSQAIDKLLTTPPVTEVKKDESIGFWACWGVFCVNIFPVVLSTQISNVHCKLKALCCKNLCTSVS